MTKKTRMLDSIDAPPPAERSGKILRVAVQPVLVGALRAAAPWEPLWVGGSASMSRKVRALLAAYDPKGAAPGWIPEEVAGGPASESLCLWLTDDAYAVLEREADWKQCSMAAAFRTILGGYLALSREEAFNVTGRPSSRRPPRR